MFKSKAQALGKRLFLINHHYKNTAMKIFLHSFFFLFTCLFLFASPSAAQEKKWMLVPFVKQDAVNPCLVPSKAAFTDPIRKSKVAWEEKDVFNPAAVVRNNKVYLLYRAQDVIGLPAGTSRIGLAYSSDGLHFKRLQKPVLYPDNDEYKKFEWEGGCNNDSENNNSEDTTINHNSGVENVNGNIPDTANTITLEGITSEKATTADTTKKN